jgi:hypothetical protein
VPTPRVMPQVAALVKAKRMLNDLGYFKIGGSGGSTYFGKLGTHHKIRVSNHNPPKQRHDFVYSITFTGPTIINDVEYQVKKANSHFIIATTMKRVANRS